MQQTKFAGMGDVYGNVRSWGRYYCEASKIIGAGGSTSRHVWSNRSNGRHLPCDTDVSQLAFNPDRSSCSFGTTVIWQYVINCHRPRPAADGLLSDSRVGKNKGSYD